MRRKISGFGGNPLDFGRRIEDLEEKKKRISGENLGIREEKNRDFGGKTTEFAGKALDLGGKSGIWGEKSGIWRGKPRDFWENLAIWRKSGIWGLFWRGGVPFGWIWNFLRAELGRFGGIWGGGGGFGGVEDFWGGWGGLGGI